jgi:hypothetical protein
LVSISIQEIILNTATVSELIIKSTAFQPVPVDLETDLGLFVSALDYKLSYFIVHFCQEYCFRLHVFTKFLIFFCLVEQLCIVV